MIRPTRFRRPAAIGIALAIVAGGLALAPAAGVSAASNTQNSSAVLTKLNAYRTDAGVTAFKRNLDIQAYAQDVADYYAAHDGFSGFNPNAMSPLPKGTDEAFFEYKVTGSETTAVAAIAKKFRDASLSFGADAFLFDPEFNYAGAGFAKKGKYTYGYIVQGTYDKSLQNTVEPGIAGTRAVGKKVTAKFAAWSPVPKAPAFQWYANGSAIEGATSVSFTITSAQRGKKLSVKVASAPSGYVGVARESGRTGAVDYGTLAATKPTVVGSRVVGSTLEVTRGNWGTGTNYYYQWLRDGKFIANAKSKTYKLTSADANKKIDARVTGKRVGYRITKLTKTVKPFTKVRAAIVGSGQKAGTVLTAQTGVWTPGATKTTFSWKRDGLPIAKATKKTYTATKADVGHELRVTVTGHRAGYKSTSVTSAARPLG